MEIEVRQPEGYFAKACIQALNEDGVTVSYAHKPSESVSYDRCRILPDKPIKNDFKSGDTIEAYYKKGAQPCEFWQKAKLRDIKGEFVIIEDVDNPNSTDIVQFDKCRPADLAQPLIFDKLHHCEIVVPEELKGYFADSKSFKDLTEMVKKLHVEFDANKMVLKVSSLVANQIRLVQKLSDLYINDSKQKFLLLQRKEEAKRALQSNDTEISQHVETFTVLANLMGLAIGTHGANIVAARKIEGIDDIVIDEAHSESSHCTFKIYAKSQEAAEQARTLLDFRVENVPVPRDMVGKIIGKSGKTIQEVVDKAGVVRVKIIDTEGDDSSTVDFQFTGTKESIESAELLIQFHLRHLKEMEDVREEIEASLSRTNRPHNPQPVYNGYSNGRQNGYHRGSSGSSRGGSSRRNLGEQSNDGSFDQSRRNYSRSNGHQDRREEGVAESDAPPSKSVQNNNLSNESSTTSSGRKKPRHNRRRQKPEEQ